MQVSERAILDPPLGPQLTNCLILSAVTCLTRKRPVQLELSCTDVVAEVVSAAEAQLGLGGGGAGTGGVQTLRSRLRVVAVQAGVESWSTGRSNK